MAATRTGAGDGKVRIRSSPAVGVLAPTLGGSQKETADKLSEKYELPRTLARQVAERKISLREAQQRDRPANRTPIRHTPSTSRIQKRAVVLMTVTVIGLTLLHARNEWKLEMNRIASSIPTASTPAPPVPDTERPVRAASQPTHLPDGDPVSFDAEGRIVQVTGRSPRAVLIDYCLGTDTWPRCEPIELATPDPFQASVRFGLFRDYDDLSKVFAVRISKSPRTGGWILGDGNRPIPRFDAQRLRLGDRVSLQ